MVADVMKSPAGGIYLTCLAFILLHLFWLLLADWYLWRTNQETVSMWLRLNPGWYFLPFIGVMLALSVLTWHLWGWK